MYSTFEAMLFNKMSTGRQSGMNVAHLVLAINVIIHFGILLYALNHGTGKNSGIV